MTFYTDGTWNRSDDNATGKFRFTDIGVKAFVWNYE